MKTVTNDFKTSWVNRGSKFSIQKINYRRRYYNPTTHLIYEETDWQSLTMPMAEFKSIGTMTWDLEAIFQEEFKMSVCTLSLLNSDYRWSPNNPGGIFQKNAAGHECVAPGTKFQIFAGYEVGSNGQTEILAMFTGRLTDYSMKPSDGVFEATVSGMEYDLIGTEAQDIVTTVTNEALVGAVDGVNKSFTSSSTGVAFVDDLKDNSVLRVDGVDYTASGYDTPAFSVNGPVSFNFVVAPTAGHTLTWSGRKWLAAKKIEDLVVSCLTQAGFTADKYAVQPVTFPNGVVSDFLLNTKALFDAGAVHADTVAVSAGGAGSDYVKISPAMIDDFEAGIGGWAQDASGDNAWGAGTGGEAGQCIATGNSGASSTKTSNYLSKASAKATGLWIMRLNSNYRATTRYAFMSTSSTGFGNGYVLEVVSSTYSLGIAFYDHAALYRSDAGVLTLLASWPLTWQVNCSGNPMAAIAVMRDSSGNFSLYFSVNGDLNQNKSLNIATDLTYTASSYVGLRSVWAFPGNVTNGVSIYDLFTMSSTDNLRPYAQYTSGEMDGAGVTAWTTVSDVASLGVAVAVPVVDTKVSSVSGSGYDPYVNSPLIPSTSSYTIASATKEFFKTTFSLNWDPADTVALSGTKIFSVTVVYSTTVATIALANFRGMSCYQAIQWLAFICDFEIGVDGLGKFYFRHKDLNVTPGMTFNQSDVMARIIEIKPGWNEVVTSAQVTYGSSYGVSRATSYKSYDHLSLPEPRPSSFDRFGVRRNAQSVTNFLFSNDGNIAAGMARAIHDNNYLEKRRVLFECRMIPHAEAGDIMQISFYEDPTLENNYWGDPCITWAPWFGVPGNVALRSVKVKILNLAQDFDTDKTRILGLEVLS